MRRMGGRGIVGRDLERGSGDDFGGILDLRAGGMIDCISGDLSIENLFFNCMGWSMV